MSFPQFKYLIFAVSALTLVLIPARQAEALARWSSSLFLEDTYASAGEESVNLFSAGVNLSVIPATKKKLNTRLTGQLRYTSADGEVLWNASPLGNVGFTLIEPSIVVRLDHLRQASVNTAAQLVQTKSSLIGLTWQRELLPAVDANWSTFETATQGRETRSDNFSLRTSYQYHWLGFRAGYARSETQSTGGARFVNDSYDYGVGGSYMVLPRTNLYGDLGFSGDSAAGESSSGRSIRLGFSSAPSRWLDFGGLYAATVNRLTERTQSSEKQFSVGVQPPLPWLRITASAGRRQFDDRANEREIDYLTLATTLDRRLRENIDFNATLSRSWQDDPEQGRNVSDSATLNSGLRITPRTFLGVSLGITRSEVAGFVSDVRPPEPDASGPFGDRVNFDGEAPGFTFLDTENSVLYVRDPFSPTGWSDPIPFEQQPDRIERFSVSKSARLTSQLTDKSTLNVLYSASASTEKLDLVAADSQRLSGTLGYRANARTSYSLNGSASFSDTGPASYGTSVSFGYRFFRGHSLNLNYGRQVPASGKATDSFSANFSANLGRRGAFNLIYGSSQLFEKEQTTFVRASFSKSF